MGSGILAKLSSLSIKGRKPVSLPSRIMGLCLHQMEKLRLGKGKRKAMAWIIVSDADEDEELAWSNTWGWASEDYDTFTDEERNTLNLPMGGHWERVAWSVQE